MMNWRLKLTTFVRFVRSFVERISACQCPRVYQAKLSHCTLNPVYHRGRPAHWHWTLSHLKEGRGTALGLSSDTKQDHHKKRKSPKTEPQRNSNPDSSLSIDNWLLINWTWGKKHAKVPWKSESFSKTKAQRTQPPDYTVIIIIKRHPPPSQSALFFSFFLPFSKNSDLRFKFFKDMDSDSTWEMENRIQWGTVEERNKGIWHLMILIYELHIQCMSLKMYHNHRFQIENGFVT